MKRHALFVGVNDYADGAFKNLRYSLSDAVALSGAFAARGFDVEVLSNPKADAVLGAVERKTSGLGPGNVWEWCNDWCGVYPLGDATDPTGPASGVRRVLRGGGWYDDARICRFALRGGNFPDYRDFNYGFRLCCSAGTRG